MPAAVRSPSSRPGSPRPPPETSGHQLLATAPADAEAPPSLAGGEHVRIATKRGPVHVWRPAGYDPLTAGIVLYVHGYYTTSDKAWAEHRLAEQFAASGRNALFIVPRAPWRCGEPFLLLTVFLRLVPKWS